MNEYVSLEFNSVKASACELDQTLVINLGLYFLNNENFNVFTKNMRKFILILKLQMNIFPWRDIGDETSMLVLLYEFPAETRLTVNS